MLEVRLNDIFHVASAGFTEEDRANNQSRTNITASLEIYVNYIEKQFLEETVIFYKIKSEEYWTGNSALDYIKKVSKVLIQLNNYDCTH